MKKLLIGVAIAGALAALAVAAVKVAQDILLDDPEAQGDSTHSDDDDVWSRAQ